MEGPTTIPSEARAAVECNALFDALRHGNFLDAANAQDRLRALGWELRRAPAPSTRGRAVVRLAKGGAR